MDWTKPLSLAMVLLVALLVVGSILELLRTTFTDSNLLAASAITMALVAIAVIVTVAAGARSKQWLDNPDSYW